MDSAGWFSLDEPVVVALVAGAAGLVVLVVLVRTWQRLRWSAYLARRRRELRRQQRHAQLRQQEIERLAGRIIATSSTTSIAGFEIVRQIEAVFTDGQPSQNKAVEALKALAAQKGANALINLGSARLVSGKCVAQGDAVVVRPLDASRGVQPPHSPQAPPGDESRGPDGLSGTDGGPGLV